MTLDENHIALAKDRTRIFFQERGSGDPVLLIPGLGYASWSFTRQMKELSAVGRVLAMDNRGAGRSGKPPGPYSIRLLADDAHAVLTQASAVPAHIVGTSMGGYVALTLALRHPEAVRSLTLIATTSGGPGAQGIPDETLKAWSNAANLSAAGYARTTMPLSFAPGWADAHPEEFERLLAMRVTAPTPVEAWRAQFAACAIYLNDGAPRGPVTAPTTIVHGTQDRVVPYPNAAHLARRIPHASMLTLQDAGHLCWIEQADVVNKIIAATILTNNVAGQVSS